MKLVKWKRDRYNLLCQKSDQQIGVHTSILADLLGNYKQQILNNL